MEAFRNMDEYLFPNPENNREEAGWGTTINLCGMTNADAVESAKGGNTLLAKIAGVEEG